MLRRLTASPAALDSERLQQFCSAVPNVTRIGDVVARAEVAVVGEISTLRIVPQPDGSPWLQATITDGTGSIVAMWTGRRRIPGIRPGQRLIVLGRGAPTGRGGRLVIYNPRYELL